MAYGDTGVFKSLPTPCIVLEINSPVFAIIDVNEAFESLTGVLKNNLIGKGFFDEFADYTDFCRNEWTNLIEKVIREKLPVKMPVIKYRQNLTGGDSAIYLFGAIAPVSGVSKLVCSFTDVTDLHPVGQTEKDSLADDDNTRLLEEAHQLLAESRQQLQSLIQSVNGIFWEADPATFGFTFVSDHVKDILGYSSDEWLAERYFWENHIHPDDVKQAVSYCQLQVNNCKDHSFDYRMIKADGSIIWIKDVVSVIIEEGKPTYLRGVMVDITETKRIEELAVLEKSILELNTTNDTTLHELLIIYLRGIETIFPGTQCSLHKVKENCLELALAPSIPATYFKELYYLPIGPAVGSCGTAAFLKERVVVADIANDVRWVGFSELALKHNLLACWSQPVINSDGVVIATLGFYYNKVKEPEESELIVIERCAAILKAILENRQKSILLEESSLLMKQGQELAGFGNWQWDILNNVVRWSDELYAIYGLDKTSFKATFEGYQELLHPDDRERIRESILGVIQNKKDIVFEERIIRRDGEVRHLKSWGRLQSDEKGIPLKMIGACLDITESKRYTKAIEQQNEKLRNIAFMQSHVVRPPLARLMSAVDLIRNYNNSEVENRQILDGVLAAAHQLDRVIRDISEKTGEVSQIQSQP